MPRKKLPPGIYKRGDVYYCQFASNGTRVRKKLSTDLEVSKVMLRKLRLRHEAGEVDNDYPVSELLERYYRTKSQSSRESTVERYRGVIDQVVAHLRPRLVSDVTADAILDYREARLGEGMTPVNTEYEIGRFRSALRWAARQRIVHSNPLEYFESAPAQMTDVLPFSVEQAESLLDACSAWWHPIIRIPFAIGLRVGELSGINVEDVDLEQRSVSVPRRIAKRFDSIRTVPILDCVYEMFQTACQGRDSGSPVFETIRGNRIYTIVRDRFARAAEKAKLPMREHDAAGELIAKRTFHSTRHSFATWLRTNGAERELVEDLRGHKRSSVIDRYFSFDLGALRDAISKHPWGIASPPAGIVPFRTQDSHKNSDNTTTRMAVAT